MAAKLKKVFQSYRGDVYLQDDLSTILRGFKLRVQQDHMTIGGPVRLHIRCCLEAIPPAEQEGVV